MNAYDILNQVITVEVAAREFNRNPSTIRKACTAKWIDAVQIGSTWLMLRADAVARWGAQS